MEMKDSLVIMVVDMVVEDQIMEEATMEAVTMEEYLTLKQMLQLMEEVWVVVL